MFTGLTGASRSAQPCEQQISRYAPGKGLAPWQHYEGVGGLGGLGAYVLALRQVRIAQSTR